MKKFIPFILVLLLTGCAATVEKIQTYSANYQAAIVAINADIAATAPLVAKACGDLQTIAMLLAPYRPNSGSAAQYLAGANDALTAYCTTIPTDIPSTAAAVARAYSAAQAGYNRVKKGA